MIEERQARNNFLSKKKYKVNDTLKQLNLWKKLVEL